MAAHVVGPRIRWTVSAGAATTVTAALLLLFRLPEPPVLLPPAQPGSVAPPSVQIARAVAADAALREETEIRDLRPLFLPTEFNATLAEPQREAGRTLLDNETLKLGFAEADLTIGRDLPAVATINGSPAEQAKPLDALAADAGGTALTGFGRRARAVVPIAARGGFVEVMSTTSGRRVLAEPLPPEARPPGDKPWDPLELLATVDAAGLATPLIVTSSSRVDEIDLHYRNFLARRFRIGDRLPPGFYRIVVAP